MMLLFHVTLSAYTTHSLSIELTVLKFKVHWFWLHLLTIMCFSLL